MPFCGNRFELRAIGSNQAVALPMMALNTVIADGCNYINKLIDGGMSVNEAIASTVKENLNIVFNGNGYSPEWPIEVLS